MHGTAAWLRSAVCRKSADDADRLLQEALRTAEELVAVAAQVREGFARHTMQSPCSFANVCGSAIGAAALHRCVRIAVACSHHYRARWHVGGWAHTAHAHRLPAFAPHLPRMLLGDWLASTIVNAACRCRPQHTPTCSCARTCTCATTQWPASTLRRPARWPATSATLTRSRPRCARHVPTIPAAAAGRGK